VLGELRVHGRAGNDTISFTGVRCSEFAEFLPESGNDVVTLGIEAESGGLRVDGGLGNDQVTLAACRAARGVRIDLSDGNDRLSTGTSEFAEDVRYIGGAGTDTLLPGAGDVVGDEFVTRGFELLD
jgi:hypothetical protein